MAKPINFAVIGCGMLARSQHIPNIAHSKKMALHTCCDVSDAALSECRDRFGALHVTKDYHAAIQNPEVEAICLATTPDLRVPIIREAAEARKPVYCEKPLANTLEEMYAIRDIVRQSGIPFCVGHNRRSSPAMLDAHRIFRNHMTNPKPCPWRYDREGAKRPHVQGDGIAAMSVRINDDWFSWKIHAFDKDRSSQGPMLFEMTHFTDMCNWFLAAEPAEVMAIEASMFSHGVVIRYATGELATIMMGANGTFGYPKELYEMMGNGGVVVVDHMLEVRTAGITDAPDRIVYPLAADTQPNIGKELGLFGWLAKTRQSCKDAIEKKDTMLVFSNSPDKGHGQAMDRFVDEIQGTGPIVCGVEDSIKATRIAFAAIKAAKEHRCVKMEEI